MFPNKSADLLTRLKSNAPDFRKPVSLVRQDSSAFISEMQDEGSELPVTESVEIARGLRGYWINSPEAVTDQTVLFFHGGALIFLGQHRITWDCVPGCQSSSGACLFGRLQPGSRTCIPCPAEDAITAYKYLLSLGLPSHRIIPAGISAGEHWCLTLIDTRPALASSAGRKSACHLLLTCFSTANR